MPEFQMLDLAKAYGAAEDIKRSQALTQNMTARTQLEREQMLGQQQATQDLQHFQERYAELQAFGKDPAWRKKIADQIRAGAPQYANASDDELVAFAEAGLKQKLGIKDDPAKQLGALYAVEDGTLLPAEEAKGRKKYIAPDKPPAPPAPREPPRPTLTEVVLPNGKRQKQWVVPGEPSGIPVGEEYDAAAPPRAQPLITPAEGASYRGIVTKANDFEAALTRFEDDLRKNGLQLGAYGEAGGRQAGLYKTVLLKLKEVQNLGVLNGPDLLLLTQQVGDPTSFKQYLQNPTLAQSLPGQISALRSQVTSERDAAITVLKESGAFLPPSAAAPRKPAPEAQGETFTTKGGARVTILPAGK